MSSIIAARHCVALSHRGLPWRSALASVSRCHPAQPSLGFPIICGSCLSWRRWIEPSPVPWQSSGITSFISSAEMPGNEDALRQSFLTTNSTGSHPSNACGSHPRIPHFRQLNDERETFWRHSRRNGCDTLYLRKDKARVPHEI